MTDTATDIAIDLCKKAERARRRAQRAEDELHGWLATHDIDLAVYASATEDEVAR